MFLQLGDAIDQFLKVNSIEKEEALFVRARRWVNERGVIIHGLMKK